MTASNSMNPRRPSLWLLAAGLPIAAVIAPLAVLTAAFAILATALVVVALFGFLSAATLALVPPLLTAITFIALVAAVRKTATAGSRAWAAGEFQAKWALTAAHEAVLRLIRLGRTPVRPRPILILNPLLRPRAFAFARH